MSHKMDENQQLTNGSINDVHNGNGATHSSSMATHKTNYDDNSNHVNGNPSTGHKTQDFDEDDQLKSVHYPAKSRAQIPRSLSLTNASCSRREPVEYRQTLMDSRSRSCVSTPDGYKMWSFQDVDYDEDNFVHINNWFDRYDTNPCSKTEVIYLHSYRWFHCVYFKILINI